MEGEETQGEQDLYAPVVKTDEENPAMGMQAWKSQSLWIGICYVDRAPLWPLLGRVERRSPRTAEVALAPQSRAAIQALLSPWFSTAVITRSG